MNTLRFAVIGEQICDSRSPAMHGAAFQALGLPHTYEAFETPQGSAASTLDRLRGEGYAGVNVTVPLKEEAALWVDCVDDTGKMLGVINTVSLEAKMGFNTDVRGFLQSLGENLPGPNHTALVLGAGGAAKAVAYALAVRLGCLVRVWNRTPDRALGICAISDRIQVAQAADPKECILIVNATSASKYGESLPVQWETAERDALAYDLFYSKEPTAFLKDALSAGLSTLDGVSMLVHQGVAAWNRWGILQSPPIAVMEAAVRDSLARDG